jgi:hypothetical protein
MIVASCWNLPIFLFLFYLVSELDVYTLSLSYAWI